MEGEKGREFGLGGSGGKPNKSWQPGRVGRKSRLEKKKKRGREQKKKDEIVREEKSRNEKCGSKRPASPAASKKSGQKVFSKRGGL